MALAVLEKKIEALEKKIEAESARRSLKNCDHNRREISGLNSIYRILRVVGRRKEISRINLLQGEGGRRGERTQTLRGGGGGDSEGRDKGTGRESSEKLEF